MSLAEIKVKKPELPKDSIASQTLSEQALDSNVEKGLKMKTKFPVRANKATSKSPSDGATGAETAKHAGDSGNAQRKKQSSIAFPRKAISKGLATSAEASRSAPGSPGVQQQPSATKSRAILDNSPVSSTCDSNHERKEARAEQQKKQRGGRRKQPAVQVNEGSNLRQTSLTQHFQVRRSERKVSETSKLEKRYLVEKQILKGNEDGLEVRVLEDKGRGVFSTRHFSCGELICEYAGELLAFDAAKERERNYEQNPDLGCYMYFFSFRGKKYCVDATKESDRLGRLLNHSKTRSNVCSKLFPIDDVPRLILVAKRDIAPGEELVYDYGDRSKSSLESHPWLKA